MRRRMRRVVVVRHECGGATDVRTCSCSDPVGELVVVLGVDGEAGARGDTAGGHTPAVRVECRDHPLHVRN